jgi:hypothetical protein
MLTLEQTHGTSHALDMCFSVMASPDQNVLIPRPGFPAYGTLLGNVGCEVREYEVLADREWECDLEAMEQQIDENTAFILVVSVSLRYCRENRADQLEPDQSLQPVWQQHDTSAFAGYCHDRREAQGSHYRRRGKSSLSMCVESAPLNLLLT